jgi:hypothetical protein
MILTAAIFGLIVAVVLPSGYSRVRALLHWNRGIALAVATPQDWTLVRRNQKIRQHYVTPVRRRCDRMDCNPMSCFRSRCYDLANPSQMGGWLNFDQDVIWTGLLPFCILVFLESAFQALGRSFLGEARRGPAG